MAEMDGLFEVLRRMGHGLRLAIRRQLASGGQAVGDRAAATGQSLSLVSQQLALLRKAELVQTRRAAKQAVSYTHLDVYKRQGGVIDTTGTGDGFTPQRQTDPRFAGRMSQFELDILVTSPQQQFAIGSFVRGRIVAVDTMVYILSLIHI